MKRIVTIATIVIGVAGPAWAIDFSAEIVDAENKPVLTCQEKTPECEKHLTLGRVVATALFANLPDEQPRGGMGGGGGGPSPEEKVKRANLALQVYNGGEHEFESQDITLMKQIIAKAYSPLIVKRAWDLLDPATKKSEKPK